MSNSEAIITSSSLSQLLFELKHIELKSPISEKIVGTSSSKSSARARERENQRYCWSLLEIKKRVGGRVVVLERGVVR